VTSINFVARLELENDKDHYTEIAFLVILPVFDKVSNSRPNMPGARAVIPEEDTSYLRKVRFTRNYYFKT